MITIRSVHFFIVLGIFLAVLLGTATYYYLRDFRRREFPTSNFEAILKRLSSVDRDNVALIPRDFVNESGRRRTDEDKLDLDPSQIWLLIGGLKGLEALERNCAVLVDLVFYIQ
jgi:hypothetical protein